MTEEELVRRIMNNCNPALVSSLRGTVHNVQQLVKVGSMVERDWAGKKDYWARVNHQAANEKAKNMIKTANTNNTELKETHHVAVAKAKVPALLVLPIETRRFRGEAVLDTGCTLTLMQMSLWQKLAKTGKKTIHRRANELCTVVMRTHPS